MGNLISTLISPISSSIDNFRRATKRKRSLSDADFSYEFSLNRSSSKRIKRDSVEMSRVIYEQFYKFGAYSDIKIVALDKEWNLHKPLLKQCPYFEVMLSDPWKEAKQDVIHIEIVDPNITVEAIDAVFGTLYCSNLLITCENVVSVVAAASHFQLESLVTKCAEVMKDGMTNVNIMKFYSVAEQYCIPFVKEQAFEALLRNVVNNKYFWPIFHEISVELMTRLIGSEDLFVTNSEHVVYRTLVRWVYYRLNPNDFEPHHFRKILEIFQRPKDSVEFLLSEEGKQFQPAFKKLRLNHILINTPFIKLLKDTRFIPLQWIEEALLSNYIEVLRFNEGSDIGPSEAEKEDLWTRGVRLGKTLKSNDHSWKWQLTISGLDLAWSFKDNTVEIWRVRQPDFSWLSNTLSERRIILRVRFLTCSKKREVFAKSEVLCLSLPWNEKITVLKIPEKIRFPAVIAVEMLLNSKESRSPADFPFLQL